MSVIIDDEGRAVGWEDVHLTELELDLMCEALDLGDQESAERIVSQAYDRLYSQRGLELLQRALLDC